MAEKVRLNDLTRCIACRGCQVACKQWNELKAKQTINQGTYQNPPGLQFNTYIIIRYQEMPDGNGGVKWLFRSESCMHCSHAACVMACPTGALYHTSLGTVGVNREICIGCKNCIPACPFDVPRYEHATDKIYKCDMCEARIMNNLWPACAKVCPTGALTWGDKDDMLKTAYDRIKVLGGDASVYGDQYVGGTHVVYVLPEKPAAYADLKQNPRVPYSVIAWKDWLKPLSLLAAGGVILAAFFHYIIHGPKAPDNEDQAEKD